jgi:glycosyltransferase involved in cell wall biosynthesis
MHVLMVSLDYTLALQHDSARARHLAYAERAGQLTIIVRTPRGHHGDVRLSPHLRMLQTGSLHSALFPFDAVRLADAVEQPDLIVTQDMFLSGAVGWWLRRRFGVPLLVQNHSYVFGNHAWLAEHPVRNRLLLGLAHFVRSRADFVRTVNQVERQQYIDSGGDPARVAALPLATASAAFARPIPQDELDARRRSLGIPGDAQVLLWVGYPVGFKRLTLLLHVFQRVAAECSSAYLLLVGDLTRNPEDLTAQIARLGLHDRIILHGPVTHADLPPFYALATVYVLTSAYEGFPRVLLEAASAGLPIVAMHAAGVDEVIEHGKNGFLAGDMDVEDMASHIIALLADPARAHALGEHGRAMALSRYNTDRYADQWVELWRQAITLGCRPDSS